MLKFCKLASKCPTQKWVLWGGMGPRPKFPAKSAYRESSFASLHRGRGIRNDSQSEGSPFLSCLGEKICVYFLTGPFLHARSVVTKNRPPPHAHWIQNCERKGPLKTSTTLPLYRSRAPARRTSTPSIASVHATVLAECDGGPPLFIGHPDRPWDPPFTQQASLVAPRCLCSSSR